MNRKSLAFLKDYVYILSYLKEFFQIVVLEVTVNNSPILIDRFWSLRMNLGEAGCQLVTENATFFNLIILLPPGLLYNQGKGRVPQKKFKYKVENKISIIEFRGMRSKMPWDTINYKFFY